MRLYEARNKEQFLATVTTKEVYEWLFNRLFDAESKLSKDVFDFTKEELMNFYEELNNSFTTLNTYNSMIGKYINWAIKNNLTRISTNPASQINTKELKDISKPDPSVIHYEIIYELIGKPVKERSVEFQGIPKLKNAQDKLLIYLIFLGIGGKSAKELRRLRVDHIVENVGKGQHLIKLSDIDPNRVDIEIDDYALKLIKDALNEDEYFRYIDESVQASNIREDYEIHEGDGYIFRKSNIGKQSNEPSLSHQAVLARLSSISKYTGEKLTISRIKKSGMAYVGYILHKNNIPLEVSNPIVQRSIFERFDITEYQRQARTIREIKSHLKEVYNV